MSDPISEHHGPVKLHIRSSFCMTIARRGPRTTQNIRKNDKSICAYVTVATLQIVSYNSRTHISKQQQVVYCLIIFISSVTCIWT